jgi:hypothetical protein
LYAAVDTFITGGSYITTDGPNGSWSGWCVMFIPTRPTPTKCSQSDVSHGRKHCVNMGTTDIDEESFIHAPGGAAFVPIQEVSHFVEAYHRDRRVDYVPFIG